MRGEIDFDDNNFREAYAVPPIGEGLDFEKAPIFNEQNIQYPFDNFEPVAKNFSRKEKIVEHGVMDESSILLQQKMIKFLISVKNPGQIEKFWQEYEDLISNYAEELTDEKKKKEAMVYFNGLGRSVLASAAVIKFFENQGFKAKFPTTTEDGYEKCDLIFDPAEEKGGGFFLAVQVKSHHLPSMGKKEVAEVINQLVLTSGDELDGKDKKDFEILSQYCGSLSKEKKNVYTPVFINMPVSREIKDEKRRRVDIIQLVDSSGKINDILKNSFEVKWKERKKMLGLDKK